VGTGGETGVFTLTVQADGSREANRKQKAIIGQWEARWAEASEKARSVKLPSTRNPQPATRNPQPATRNPKTARCWRRLKKLQASGAPAATASAAAAAAAAAKRAPESSRTHSDGTRNTPAAHGVGEQQGTNFRG